MSFVLRQIHPPGKTARADEATLEALTLATLTSEVVKGHYLQWSDPDAKGGRGDERWTGDIKKAKHFATFAEAMDCWTAQSTKRPYRPDGRPNKPLTAFSISVEEVT